MTIAIGFEGRCSGLFYIDSCTTSSMGSALVLDGNDRSQASRSSLIRFRSANKISIGVIRDGEVLSNPRRTYITPPGE